MSQAVAEIRSLFEDWVDAVRRCDLDAAVAPHTSDVVMFDVPETVQIRGIDAYRDCWRDFLPFIADGGVFEVSELSIHAGNDTAFSHCIVTCGSSRDDVFPVRLTMGYRKVDGRWMIAHEHHSVPASAEP